MSENIKYLCKYWTRSNGGCDNMNYWLNGVRKKQFSTSEVISSMCSFSYLYNDPQWHRTHLSAEERTYLSLLFNKLVNSGFRYKIK
jgi:hypothetical protein